MVQSNRMVMNWVEQGMVPDAAIRSGIRRLLKRRLDELPLHDSEAAMQAVQEFVRMMDAAEVAPMPEKANEQHYEVPAAFFAQLLGPYRKYSCCYWGPDEQTLEQAEQAALRISCEHAELGHDMEILDLGCGWGSMTLWMATHYPNGRVDIFAVRFPIAPSVNWPYVSIGSSDPPCNRTATARSPLHWLDTKRCSPL